MKELKLDIEIVIKDNKILKDKIIFGYRGDNLMETGMLFCPYIFFMRGPQVKGLFPNNFYLTRYAKCLSKGFYGVIEL